MGSPTGMSAAAPIAARAPRRLTANERTCRTSIVDRRQTMARRHTIITRRRAGSNTTVSSAARHRCNGLRSIRLSGRSLVLAV